ncbi:uncharacterized protein LOC113218075 [Frankliniella occidentalis]|uniref:Uncharacterized protein LOC113218075 n=1 Tax=Frankliniella occidentalis TaxID=133901 RepID=A0A9C6XA21_FRAOC|nr:uncharacterized protein LOC113218075 [Frankliniella occidentalis]
MNTLGWCPGCGAVATRHCWVRHNVLTVNAALEQLLQGDAAPSGPPLHTGGPLAAPPPLVARHLERLKDGDHEGEALQALTLLSGKTWDVILRGGGHVLSGTLRDIKDPETKALLLLMAAKGELTSRAVDCAKDLGHKDQALNLKMILGVRRLLNVPMNDLYQEVLEVAAPTVEQLSLLQPTDRALCAAFVMPRLRRLRVDGFVDESLRESLHTIESNLELNLKQGHVQWLELVAFPPTLLKVVLKAQRLSLEVLQLTAPDYYSRLDCDELLSVLEDCELRSLRRLVLVKMLDDVSPFYDNHVKFDREGCVSKREALLEALPEEAEVVCALCDGESVLKPMMEQL